MHPTSELPPDDWRTRKAAHEARLAPWVSDRVARAGRGRTHPVYDFLFEYYSHRPGHLLRWSPGAGVLLLDATSDDIAWKQHFVPHPRGLWLPPAAFPEHRRGYLRWAVEYMKRVADREPLAGCFGLHEWAMVYRTADVRHSHVPLRVTDDVIADTVEAVGLRCTHYDAFRFFTPAAAPRNRVALTRADAPTHDQPGCVHANMDLYKFAYAAAPFVSGELTADCFALAADARALDMRASPYDLSRYGYSPVPIETKAGRDEYVIEQRKIAAAAEPLRRRMIAAYERLAAE